MIRAWLADETAAVTVDWVVLAAAMIALGVGIISQLSGGMTGVATALSDALSGATIRELSFD